MCCCGCLNPPSPQNNISLPPPQITDLIAEQVLLQLPNHPQRTSCPHHPTPQITDLIAEGYPAQQVLLQLQSEVLAAPASTDQPGAVPPRARALVCEQLAEADKCLQDGADEFLQLLHVGAQVQKAICG